MNQDAIVIDDCVLQADMDKIEFGVLEVSKPALFAVADGLGGHERAAFASEFALNRLCELISEVTSIEKLELVLEKINYELFLTSKVTKSQKPPGTTCAGFLVYPSGEVLVFGVGDSRVYSGGSEISQRTTDHRGKTQSSVTQTLGGMRIYEQLSPSFWARSGSVGDVFLACTDGLSDFVDIPSVYRGSYCEMETFTETLCRVVWISECLDNVSVIVVKCDSVTEKK